MTRGAADLGLLDDVVRDPVLKAMRIAASEFSRLGVRHWLVGGLAVGAYGYPRATKAVEFFVGDEAFEVHSGGIVTMKPGVPIQANGVIVDHLSAQAGEDFLRASLPSATETLAVAPIEVLLYPDGSNPEPASEVQELEHGCRR